MHLVRILLPCLIAASCHGFAYADASCPQLFQSGQPPALINQKLALRSTLLCNDAYASLASGSSTARCPPNMPRLHPSLKRLKRIEKAASTLTIASRKPTKRSWPTTAGAASIGPT